MATKYRVQGPDGAVHVFEGPDDATPVQIETFAAQTFGAAPKPSSGMPVGRKGNLASQIPGYGGPVPAAPQAPAQGYGGPLPEALMAPIETAVTLGTGLVTAPIVEASKIGGTLLSGKYGTQEGIKAGEAVGRKVQQFFQPAISPTAQGQVESIGNALASTGLQGVPLNVLGDLQRGVAPALRATADTVRAPLAARAETIKQARIRESQINAPRIDAAKDAFDMGFALDPALSNPSAANRMRAATVGSTALHSNLSKLNLPKVAMRAKEDMGLPETMKLDAKAFDTAMDAPKISEPYDKVRAIPSIVADDAVLTELDNLRIAPAIGDTGQAASVNNFLDTVKQQLQSGANGKTIVDGIRQRRRDAQAIYNQQSAGINPPSPEAIARADVSMGVAKALENAIENSIADPRLLAEFRTARALAGRINDYRRATNLATGVVDPQELAKLAAEGRPLSGNLAKIANTAANFPENMQGGVVREPAFTEKLTRSSAGGTVGAILGAPFGLPGAIVGGGLGAALGNVGAGMAARRMATPGFQRSTAMPTDYRPVPLGTTPADINYGPNQLVPYRPEVVGPSTGGQANKLRIIGYNENGQPIYKAEESRQGFTTPQQPPGFGPTVFESQRGLPNEVPRQIYEAQKNAELAQEFRAAAERKPASRGQELVFDPVTKRLVPAQKGMPTATVDIIESTGKTTTSAAEKALAGQFFNMSATEKIAWSKSLLEGMPTAQGEAIFGKLSPEKIAARMDDRAFAQKAIDKAREMAQMYDDLAKRQANETARRDAAILREQMYDKADMMEESLRNPRPVSGKGQGPKTRAAQRNQLAPEQEIQNALAKPFEVTIRGIGSTK
jgi:hypothetical protein